MKIATASQAKRAAHKAKFAAVAKELLQRKVDMVDVDRSSHKVGHHGDRSRGWSKSIPKTSDASELNLWRESVLMRDGYKCVSCGSLEELEADHIKPKALYPDLRYDVSNGRILCHHCHTQTATYGRKVHRIVDVVVEETG